jgi:hypothetical protein
VRMGALAALWVGAAGLAASDIGGSSGKSIKV